MRRTVTGLALAAILMMPTASMAAQRHQVSHVSWWQTIVEWVVQVTGFEKSTSIPTTQTAAGSVPTSDARSLIDPNGEE
jgi:hypothetical protein